MTADEMYRRYRLASYERDYPEQERLMDLMMQGDRPDLTEAINRAQDEYIAETMPGIRRWLGDVAAQELDATGDTKTAALVDRIFFGDPTDPDA